MLEDVIYVALKSQTQPLEHASRWVPERLQLAPVVQTPALR